MKRITKQMKQLDLYASLINLLYILIASIFIGYFFSIMHVPERSEWTSISITHEYHTFWGATITQGDMNVFISLLVGFLIVSVPVTFKSMKRPFDKETIEIDEWNYRHQYLLAGFELLTLNPFSAAIRIYNGRIIQLTVREYGIKQGLLNTLSAIKKGFVSFYKYLKRQFMSLVGLFNKQKQEEARLLKAQRALEKAEGKKQTKSQEDLDEITRKDYVRQVFRIVLTYGTLTFVAIFIFVPFYWMVITALKTYQESSTAANPKFFIGLEEMQWINFKIVLTEFSFLQFIGNTIFVGISTMIFTVLTTILASFAFSRLDFKGKEFIFSLLLMTMMIPGELYTITNYITVSRLDWIDTYYALIVPFSASVFYIFFLRQAFRQIPDTLYRAAKVDGSSDFKYLTRIMIPIASPTIITIIILSSIGAWDAYIWPQLVSRTDPHTLVSVALRNSNFSVGSGSDQRPMYNMQLAATTVVTVPLLIVFFTLKKYILAGVGRSGTKG